MVSALIIEDETALRVLYQRALEHVGFETEVAEDGTVAIEYLANHAPDLILLDIRMPNINGLDVILYLQEYPNIVHIHVVIISASYEFQRYTKMLPSAEFLQKPVLSQQLHDIAERVKQASME